MRLTNSLSTMTDADIETHVWRCDVTKNPVGTDTEMLGCPCRCQGCVAGRAFPALLARLKAAEADLADARRGWEQAAETIRELEASGNCVYCFGGNPNIGLYYPKTTNYSYGFDGGFSIGEMGFDDISIDDAIEIADAMIKTWVAHKKFLLSQKG